MQKTITLLILLFATLTLHAQDTSLDLDFSMPGDAERFTPIFDTGGEFVKSVSDGQMKVVLNKKEWHFLQIWLNSFDFVGNPFISFRVKADQRTPIRIWLNQGPGKELTIYNSTIEAGTSFQTIAFTVENIAPLDGPIREIGIELGGYQVPPATFAGTVYFDHFRLGEAAMPNNSLSLGFSDPAEANRLNYIFDTGGEVTKSVANGELKLVLNKKEWHFFQVWVDPLNFLRHPYFAMKVKVEQPTPIRIWIRQQGVAVEKVLFNSTLQASADYQNIQLAFPDAAPIAGYIQELNMDIGGYQVPPASFRGVVYFDELKLGETAKPATEVFGTGYSEDFSTALFSGWKPGEGYSLARDGDALKFDVNRSTPVAAAELDKLPSIGFEGKVLDISDNPFLNLEVRGNDPFVLSAIIVDNSNQRKERTLRVVPTGNFQTLSFNIGAIEGLNTNEIERIYFDFNRSGFAFNSDIWFDNIRIGDKAMNYATMDAIDDKAYFVNSGARRVLLTNIANATHVSVVSGAPALCRNMSAGDIANGAATLSFDVVGDGTGTAEVRLKLHGAPGYADQEFAFDLTVEANLPPTLAAIGDVKLAKKERVTIRLGGISDGNSTIEQPLVFSVRSSDDKVVTGAVESSGEGPSAELILYPQQHGTATVTVAVQDDGQSDHTTAVSFSAVVFNHLNGPPTIDAVDDFEVYQDAGPSTLTLTGISDGDKENAKLAIAVAQTNPAIMRDVYVTYSGGADAVLHYTPEPAATGMNSITVTVTDDSGTGSNDGDNTTTITFDVTIVKRPVEGYVATLVKAVEGYSANSKYVITEVDSGAFRALVFNATDKFYWDGVTMQLPEELDLCKYPYLTMEVYPVGQNTEHWLWFYDADGVRNDLTNRSGDHIQKAVAGKWNKLTFDFSGENDWINSSLNAGINNKRITRILFDMHNAAFTWPPPPNYTGTFIVRNLRIGSAADVTIVATATLDPIADQVAFTNQQGQRVLLAGISDGKGGMDNATVSVEQTGPSIVSGLTISEVSGGVAELTYNTTGMAGTAEVTVHVNAPGSAATSRTFRLTVIDPVTTGAPVVEIDIAQRFQSVYGFGTFSMSSAYNDLYATEMGGSAMRVGLIGNQFEPVNDNDDPEVLDMDAFNYGAFDWSSLRDLREKGVRNFILTSWSPPAWMKTNLSLDHYRAAYTKDTDGTTNRLDYHQYEEFAESMVAVVKAFKQRAGIDLLGIGLQNEPAFHEPYPSAILGPDRFVELIKVVGRRFRREGITTKLYMAEQVSNFVADNNQYLDAVQADPEANEYCDVFAIHGYGSDGITPGQPNFSEWQGYRTNAAEGPRPKSVWMTETHKAYDDWTDALQIAGAIYGALEHGDVSLWTQWSFEGPFVAQGKPTGMLYAVSQFSRFIQPGYTRVKTTSANEDVLATSFVDPATGGAAVVLINKGTVPLAVQVAGPDLGTTWEMYTSADNRNREKLSAFRDNVFLLPARSVTTLTNSPAPAEATAGGAGAGDEAGETEAMYPNPNDGQFWVASGVTRVEIADMTGHKRFAGDLAAGQRSVSVGHLESGLYIVSMYGEGGSVVKKRIVIH